MTIAATGTTSSSDLFRTDTRSKFQQQEFEMKAAAPVFGELTFSTAVGQSPSSRISRSRNSARTRVKRKLRGILISFSGEDAIVIFESKGERFEYVLPSDLLRKNRVTVAYQPFELIETEVTDNDGAFLQSKVVPLAEASSG